GDELGSRLISVQLAGDLIWLAFALSRRWPPYAKWRGTAFHALPLPAGLAGPLSTPPAAAEWRERGGGLAAARANLLAAPPPSAAGAGRAPCRAPPLPPWGCRHPAAPAGRHPRPVRCAPARRDRIGRAMGRQHRRSCRRGPPANSARRLSSVGGRCLALEP